MRFGISATSLIVPKNFLTRLRPVNVCAIFSLSIRLRRAARAPLRTAAFHRDHRDRRRAVRFYAIRAWPGPLLFTVTADRSYGRLSCRDPRGLTRGFRFISSWFGLTGPSTTYSVSIPRSRCSPRGFRLSKCGLLKLNLRTGLFGRGLDLVGLVLCHAFIYVHRRAFD